MDEPVLGGVDEPSPVGVDEPSPVGGWRGRAPVGVDEPSMGGVDEPSPGVVEARSRLTSSEHVGQAIIDIYCVLNLIY